MDITINISGQDILNNPSVAEAVVALARTVSGESEPLPVITQALVPTSVERLATTVTESISTAISTDAVADTPATVVQNIAPSAPIAPPATYTLEQLALAAAPLMDAGKTQELVALLQTYGVQTLQQIPPEKYNTFAVAIRGMGAQI